MRVFCLYMYVHAELCLATRLFSPGLPQGYFPGGGGVGVPLLN